MEIYRPTTTLECTIQVCSHGEGGTHWRTHLLPESAAIEMLKRNLVDCHGQQVGGGGGGVDDGEGQVQLDEIPHLVITGGCSQEEFKYFRRQWNMYVGY